MMIKHSVALLSYLLVNLFTTSNAFALPSEALVRELNNSVLRVEVVLANGKQGLGSAVVVAKDEVITNCHVVKDATNITLVVNGLAHLVSAIKPDWRHDLCMLKSEGLNVPTVKIGSTENLKYDASLFTVGYPGETTTPVNTYGAVTGIFPLDGSVVIKATSPFSLGASGGGVFDDAGSLVGIITLKSKGQFAHYYYMPVEWVQALINKPAQILGATSEKPFWAAGDKQKPYFMQVVQPFVSHDWQSLLKVSLEWTNAEPNTAESWFYLAIAELETKSYDKAVEHFKKVLVLNESHTQAIKYLNKISEKIAHNGGGASQLALLTN